MVCHLKEKRVGGDPGAVKTTAQVVSLLAYLVFPNSTLQDVIKAIQPFPWYFVEADDIPVGCIRIACIPQENYAIIVTFLLVMSSDNALDIILNFTAVNFISDLDEAAFSFAKSGVFGPILKEETKRIADTKLPACLYRESKQVWFGIVTACTAMILFAVMVVATIAQENS